MSTPGSQPNGSLNNSQPAPEPRQGPPAAQSPDSAAHNTPSPDAAHVFPPGNPTSPSGSQYSPREQNGDAAASPIHEADIAVEMKDVPPSSQDSKPKSMPAKDVGSHDSAQPVSREEQSAGSPTVQPSSSSQNDVAGMSLVPSKEKEVNDNNSSEGANVGDDQGAEPTPEAYDANSKWWTLALKNVFNLVELDDPDEGIAPADAPRRATELGDNVIPISGGKPWYMILAAQFMNAITVVLLIVVVISGVFKDWAEFGVVLFVLFFNAGLGFYQEFGAEKSLESLKEMTAGSAKVIRAGQPAIVFVDEVVIGDVVILEQGASVPADCRVFESSNLEVDEALLTGEALPVLKHTNVIRDAEGKCALGDRKNMVYRNTVVTQGRGKAVVVAGGLQTEMGKLAKRLDDGKSSSKTPLMKKLDYMMYFLFGCCIVLAIVVFAANKMKYDPSTLSYATAVAIAILPESLAAVITVAMTMSVKHMAKQKCIVRKLAVLEVLGNVTDVCSDKTGTLTENKMVVKKAVIGLDDVYGVLGAPYATYGDFVKYSDTGVEGEHFRMGELYPEKKNIYEFLRCSALCSTTVMHISETDMDVLTGNGNPTEIAIQVMTWKAQLTRDTLEEEGWDCIAEYAFDSTIKRMSAAWYNEDKRQLYLCTKGAPERVFALCNYRLDENGKRVDLTAADRRTFNAHVESLAEQGLRTICLSYRDDATALFNVPEEPFGDVHKREVVEQDLVFLGLVGIYDPPRPESRPSVLACQHAGICVRMLTGDHTSTAGSIAAMLNIILHRDLGDPVMLQAGPEFDRVDPAVVDGWAELPFVIGRCSPESKVKMIESLHRRKRVVAMTGDGFNDSPSIKIADIGCAMGSGTDVTKGVADLVITDDNFATIVKAIAEGRRISQCIRKFVVHLLSSNVAEVIALICGLPIRHEGIALFILSPIEILWLNMFTSSPPSIGLSMDKATSDILRVPPNTGGFFTIELLCDTFVYGFWLGTVTLLGFVLIVYGFADGPRGTNCNSHNGEGCNMVWSARCTAFGILYFGLLIHVYTVRHPRMSVFRMRWFDNPWIYGSVAVGTILFVPIVYINPIAHNLFVHNMLTWHWGVLAVAVLIFFAICELYKVAKNCVFPIRKIAVHVDGEDDTNEREQRQEYDTFTQTGRDDRDVASIAEENLRMSFASHAESVATAGASFRLGNQRKKPKKKLSNLFSRMRNR